MSPIVLFVYNRPEHTSAALNALAACPEAKSSVLYVFSDAPRNDAAKAAVDEVRQLCHAEHRFAEVRIEERVYNYGLASNIIKGLSDVFTEYETAIVLEDDLRVSPSFLTFMNAALTHYESQNVFSIGGYTPPIDVPHEYQYSTFMVPRNCSWGWATWRNRWESVDWRVEDFGYFIRNRSLRQAFSAAGNDLTPMLLRGQIGEINSWSIRFCYSAFKQSMPTVYPVSSLVQNGGADGSGTHQGASERYETTLADGIDIDRFAPDDVAQQPFTSLFADFYCTSPVRQIINFFKRVRYVMCNPLFLHTDN